MRYREVAQSGLEYRNPPSHPFIIDMHIKPEDWHRFDRLTADAPEVNVLGRRGVEDGHLVVRVACATETVRDRLREAW
jgi:hypothetical protein